MNKRWREMNEWNESTKHICNNSYRLCLWEMTRVKDEWKMKRDEREMTKRWMSTPNTFVTILPTKIVVSLEMAVEDGLSWDGGWGWSLLRWRLRMARQKTQAEEWRDDELMNQKQREKVGLHWGAQSGILSWKDDLKTAKTVSTVCVNAQFSSPLQCTDPVPYQCFSQPSWSLSLWPGINATLVTLV